MAENILQVTDDSFEQEILKSDVPRPGGFLGGLVRPL